MSELIKNEPTDIANTADVSFGGSMAAMGMMTQLAEIIANSSALPESLTHDKPKDKGGKLLPLETRRANAFLIVNQARQWDCDPMSLAQGVSIIYGRIMYEGKIVAGIVNARAGLVAPLDYEHFGEGDNRTCRVFGRLARDPQTVREVSVVFHKVRTKNQMWKDDPDQMLTYRGIRQWARRHTPSILMGVAEDQTEMKQIVADEYEKPAIGSTQEGTKTDPAIVEAGHMEAIVKAVNSGMLEDAYANALSDRELTGGRLERVTGRYHVCKRVFHSADSRREFEGRIHACDFNDAKSVKILGDDIKASEVLIEQDIAFLRELFGAEKANAETE